MSPIQFNSNPTPSNPTTNSPTNIEQSTPYTLSLSLRHNTRLISRNKELQDTIEKARNHYKKLLKANKTLSRLISYLTLNLILPTLPEEIQELLQIYVTQYPT